MDSKKVYPNNIHGVKQFGAEEWLKSYFEPANFNDYQHLFDEIMAAFIDNLPSEENYAVRSVALSHFKLVPALAQQCFYYLKAKRLKSQGYEFIIEEDKLPIDAYLKKFSGKLIYFTKLNGVPAKERWRFNWWNLRANSDGTPLGLVKALFAKNTSEYLLLGDKSKREFKSFCDKFKCEPSVFYPQCVNAENAVLSKEDEELVLSFTDNFFAQLQKALPEATDFIDSSAKSDVKNSFIYGAKLFQCYTRYIDKQLPAIKGNKLLITHVGNEYYRLFGFAWKKMVGEVFTFAHGNNFINTYKPNPMFFISNMGMSNNFVVSSEGEAKLIHETRKNFTPPLAKDCNVVQLDSMNKSIYDRLQKELPPVDAVKKVMLIGTPFTYHYPAYHPGSNVMPLMHQEIRLLKLMKECDVERIYKAHPDTMSEIKGLFEPYTEHIETINFEKVMNTADCFVFTTHATTTFGYALLSNRPIILFYNPNYSWHPDVLELLKKRCYLIETTQLDNDQITFDQEQFKKLLKAPVKEPNYDVLEKYAF